MMNKRGKNILSGERFGLTLTRLCHQIIEHYPKFDNLCLIGIQESGVRFGERIRSILSTLVDKQEIPFGKLDITFFRDDFRRRDEPISAKPTEIDFLIEGKTVLLVDDVLYSGRTIHAAMTALQQFGRPDKIELMVLVDRRFNRHFPIEADYVGITVDALDQAYVRVDWKEEEGKDRIMFYATERK